MDAAIQQKVEKWLEGNDDAETKQGIKKLQADNPEELADAFYKNLEFGTGGLNERKPCLVTTAAKKVLLVSIHHQNTAG